MLEETSPGRLKLRHREGKPRMSEGQREEQRCLPQIGSWLYWVVEGAEGMGASSPNGETIGRVLRENTIKAEDTWM